MARGVFSMCIQSLDRNIQQMPREVVGGEIGDWSQPQWLRVEALAIR